MVAGLDSAFAPNAASIAQAHAAGIRLWAGYFAGPNILNGWSLEDFQRVRLGGLATLAYCSGWSDPVAVRAQSASWGVPICLDNEGGIRADGDWVPAWLQASGAGLYGTSGVHAGRGAAFHILAAYPGYDPNATWHPLIARPSAPCGWQWRGTHQEFGVGVDRCWLDDWFAGASAYGGGTTGHNADPLALLTT